MHTETTSIGKYKVIYLNKGEFKTLKEEIFLNEIYSIDIGKNRKEKVNILDVGAHIGLSTLYFKLQYPNSNIVCFEPNPFTFSLLKENIFTNSLKNVEIHNIAVAKNSFEKEFFIDSSGRNAFSTGSFRKDAWNGTQKSKSIKVKTEPLSKYIKNEIDLIKLDVEGVEREILKELEKQNCFKNIRNMIIEYHPTNGQRIKNILKILRRNSFTLDFYQDHRQLHEPREDLILIVAKKRVNNSK